MTYRKRKPQFHEKADRNRMLVGLHKAYPEYTFSQLGKAFGISKQRAWYIIVQQARNHNS